MFSRMAWGPIATEIRVPPVNVARAIAPMPIAMTMAGGRCLRPGATGTAMEPRPSST